MVDLKTKKFKVMEVQKKTKVEETQKKLGVRSSSQKAPVSTKSSEADLLKFINNDIRSKYFKGENVKCIDYKKTEQGFYLIYQRASGEKVGFDVVVSKKDGNLIVNYQVFLENQQQTSSSSQSQQSSSTSQTQQSSSSSQQTVSKKTTKKVAVQKTSSGKTNLHAKPKKPTAPKQKTGGYSLVKNPMKSKVVINALTFLMNKVNIAVKYAALVKAESQVVNGYNIKLTISFDIKSTAVYVIVVYQTTDGKFSVTSISLENVAKEPKFDQPLTAEEIAKLSFFSTLESLVIKEDVNLQGKGVVLR